MASIEIELPYPPTVNTYWRNAHGRVLISAKGRAYREEVIYKCVGCRANLLGRLSVHIDAFPPDHRRRDIDNICKALLDALAHAGVYEDDSQIDDLRVVRKQVFKGGCVVVRIEEM